MDKEACHVVCRTFDRSAVACWRYASIRRVTSMARLDQPLLADRGVIIHSVCRQVGEKSGFICQLVLLTQAFICSLQGSLLVHSIKVSM